MDVLSSLKNVIEYLHDDEAEFAETHDGPCIFDDVHALNVALEKLERRELVIVDREALERIVTISTFAEFGDTLHAREAVSRLADIRRMVLEAINQKPALADLMQPEFEQE